MKIALLLFTLIFFNPLNAHGDNELTGTYLGISKYSQWRFFNNKGPSRPATRAYVNDIKGEKGSYHIVLLEYVDLLKMAPQYLASNKLPWANNIIGYLKNITKKVTAYKAIPTSEEHKFNMYPLKVVNNKIEANLSKAPRVLKLSPNPNLQNPFAGAIISSVNKDQPKEIFFPAEKDGKGRGLQYNIAHFVYKKFKLDSTWRKTYLPGPYLSSYARLNDTVLTLKTENGLDLMEFITNPKFENLSPKKRERMFTNKKSAFLQGKYESTMPEEGMFILTPLDSNEETDNILKGRIGFFIDIFDATKALNQDVVELVFINPNDPEDFLMYYEHPDNGEGNDED